MKWIFISVGTFCSLFFILRWYEDIVKEYVEGDIIEYEDEDLIYNL